MNKTQVVIQAINDASTVPFQWGLLDCCRFGDSVARAVTGRSFMGNFHYSSLREAAALINTNGGLLGLITRALNVEPDGVLQLQDGDPVLVDLELGPTVGVKLGDRVVMKTEDGVGWLPVLAPEVLCGWSLEAACQQQ